MSDLSKKLVGIISRTDSEYSCMIMQMFIDDVGVERANEILDLSEGMSKYKNYLTENEAQHIVSNMINFDNTKGAKWTPEELKNAINTLGGKCEIEGQYNWWAMYVTAQMVRSDEWGVLRSIVDPSKEAAVCYELAKAKLLDKDGLFNVRLYFKV